MSPSILIAAVLALAAGLGIAWVDSRPTWDDTGVTAAALIGAAGLAAFAGVAPWLAALLVAAPVVVAELHGGYEVLMAIPFALAGGFAGTLVRRVVWSACRRCKQEQVEVENDHNAAPGTGPGHA